MKGQKAYSLAQSISKKMHEKALDIKRDDEKTLYYQYFALIRKAAYEGHVEALYDMGQQYEDVGYLGMPNPMYNPKKCVYWYTKACQKGHAEACNNLSNFYALGEGCEQNFEAALELLKRSSGLGSRLGKKNYKMKLRDLAKTGRYLKS